MWLVTLSLVVLTSAEVFFKEIFDAGWQSRWVESSWRTDGSQGKFKQSSGLWSVDPQKDVGIQTSADYRFYGISAKFPAASNRDRDLVVSFTVKHEQGLDCGGGYIKLLPAGFDQANFGGDTPFFIMFGPDICGGDRKTHLLLPYQGKNYLPNKKLRVESDMYTHEYTAVIKPDNTFYVTIDSIEIAAGNIEDYYDILPAKSIVDADAVRPEDWVDDPMIADPEDKKPQGWDDIPEFIPDPSASMPEDWEEGHWEPPRIRNPSFVGDWRPRMIPNPNYKGPWQAPKVANPEYQSDPNLYVIDSFGGVGIEIWQVRSGSIFDNIYIGDSIADAKQFSKDQFDHRKKGEPEAKIQFDEAQDYIRQDLKERVVEETEDDFEHEEL
jgi:calreticulin